MNDFEVATRVPFVVIADELDDLAINNWRLAQARYRSEEFVPWVMQEEGEA